MNLRRVDVNVHNPRPGRKLLQLPRHTVVEPDADGQQQVCLVHRVVCRHRPVHSQHLQRHRVLLRERTQSHQRLHHGDVGPLHELGQLGVRVHAPAPHVQHRPLGLLHRLNDRLQLVHLGRLRQPLDVSLQVDRLVPVGNAERLLHVLRDVHQHRPRAPGARQVERLLHNARNILHVHHQVVVLGDLARDLDDRRLLEPVRPDELPRDLARDGHQGNAVQERIGQSRNEVRGTRPRRGDANAHLAGDLGVALGRKDLSLLVTAENITDRIAPGKRLMNLKRRTTRVREERVDALPLQALHQHVRSLARLVTKPVHPLVQDVLLRERLAVDSHTIIVAGRGRHGGSMAVDGRRRRLRGRVLAGCLGCREANAARRPRHRRLLRHTRTAFLVRTSGDGRAPERARAAGRRVTCLHPSGWQRRFCLRESGPRLLPNTMASESRFVYHAVVE